MADKFLFYLLINKENQLFLIDFFALTPNVLSCLLTFHVFNVFVF